MKIGYLQAVTIRYLSNVNSIHILQRSRERRQLDAQLLFTEQ